MDLFVVPTIGFDLFYAFVIVQLDRRDLVWINVTANPTVEWVARQITEAFPWDEAPHYLIRDRDRIYSSVVTRRLRAMGIRDKPTAPPSPKLSILCSLFQSCFITPIRLCDWREEVLLIWMRSRGVIWVLPRAMNEALSRRFAER